MNTISRNRFRAAPRILCFAILTFLASLAEAEGLGEFVVLANKNNPVEEIAKTDLARLYLSKTKKIDGQAYKVINLAAEEAKKEFLIDLTSMSDAEIERHYIALELRGEGKKPKEVSSSKSMIFLLVKSDRIIGWLPTEDYQRLSDDVKDHIRVIRIK